MLATMFGDPFDEMDRVAANLLEFRQRPRLMPIDLNRDGDRYILNAGFPESTPGRWTRMSTKVDP